MPLFTLHQCPDLLNGQGIRDRHPQFARGDESLSKFRNSVEDTRFVPPPCQGHRYNAPRAPQARIKALLISAALVPPAWDIRPRVFPKSESLVV